MNVKSNIRLLSEMAESDVKIGTQVRSERETIVREYADIPELEDEVCTEASDVIVHDTSDGYYVEMVNLAPFMMDAGLKKIGEALDLVAEANGLDHREIGLIVDSHVSVGKMLESAEQRANRSNNPRILESALGRVKKDNDIISHLFAEGYRVRTKNKKAKVCPKCGKAKCRCECGDSNSGYKFNES